MVPENVCPIMCGQFVIASNPNPTVYYQICIQGNCQMWDKGDLTCGLKNRKTEEGIPISACEKICEWCRLKKAAPKECDPCRVNDIMRAYYHIDD
jgi:hypothetical protein